MFGRAGSDVKCQLLTALYPPLRWPHCISSASLAGLVEVEGGRRT